MYAGLDSISSVERNIYGYARDFTNFAMTASWMGLQSYGHYTGRGRYCDSGPAEFRLHHLGAGKIWQYQSGCFSFTLIDNMIGTYCFEGTVLSCSHIFICKDGLMGIGNGRLGRAGHFWKKGIREWRKGRNALGKWLKRKWQKNGVDCLKETAINGIKMWEKRIPFFFWDCQKCKHEESMYSWEDHWAQKWSSKYTCLYQ